MGRPRALLTLTERIFAVARLLDEAALTALANKGLVRRARADLAAAQPVLRGEVACGLQVAIESLVVELRERPTDSRCDCRATGMCRHILTAWLFVAGQAAPTAVATTTATLAGAEILALDDDAIRRWAGSALVRRAGRELAAGLQVECSDGPVFVARLAELNVECRWLPGAGPSGMLCNCHAESTCLHRVAVVLAWQVAHGVRQPAPLDVELTASAEAPRTRDEVRLAAARACEDVVAQGLSRLAPAMGERLRTLATSAHGVDLPRLERVLRGLADEIAAWLARSARASEAALLTRCATAHTLARALATPMPATVGVHRSRYDCVRDLELAGAGARAWRTASGYRGLTVYFWDVASAAWNTWSEARPIATPDFDPQARFTAPGPWSGSESPALASVSRVRLRGAWRARNGRLSGRASTTMLTSGPSGAAQLPAPTTDWHALVDRARSRLVLGLAEHDEAATCVLVQPATWQPPQFDALAQQLTVTLGDAAGRTIALVLEHTAENQRAMQTLETLQPTPELRLFGLLTLRRGELAIAPVSVIAGERVLSLGFADAAGVSPTATPAVADAAAADDFDVEDEDAAHADAEDAIGRLLADAWSALEAVAAAGTAAFRDWDRFAQQAKRADDLGLGEAARRLRRVAERARTPHDDRERAIARVLLDAAWVVQLTESAALVERAAARIG